MFGLFSTICEPSTAFTTKIALDLPVSLAIPVVSLAPAFRADYRGSFRIAIKKVL
jgi:hypothetical protein